MHCGNIGLLDHRKCHRRIKWPLQRSRNCYLYEGEETRTSFIIYFLAHAGDKSIQIFIIYDSDTRMNVRSIKIEWR